MKYDDYKWHLNENFPKDLDENRALTHMGFFMGWVIDKGFEGDLLNELFPKALTEFRQRKITGAKFLELCCDSKLVSEDLCEEANAFAVDYYATDKYFDDYADASDDNNETIFHEADTWENYQKIKNIIDNRYQKWKNK